MGNATRILVTHHVHFLPRCDKVIVLEGGQIKYYGKYSELIEAGVDFAGAVEFEGEESQKEEDVTEEGTNETESNEATGDVTKESTGKDVDENDKKLQKSGENLTTKEEREEGAVDSGAYFHYAKSGGMITFISIFVVQGLGRASEIGSAFWLAHWAKESVGAIVDGDPMSDKETTFYLNIYAALGMAGVFGLTVRSILMAVHRLNASRLLHNNLTNSILRAPVSFFDGKFMILVVHS
jgi:ABC-type multidrug transport system fused ATPase/permease subunit